MDDDTQGQGYPWGFLFTSDSSPPHIAFRDLDTGAWVHPSFYPLSASPEGPRAATSEAIVGLEELTGRSRSGEECAVCLQDFCADDTLRAMPYSHAFHHSCISQWLRRRAACPLCRHQLPAAPGVTEEEDDGESGGRRVFAFTLPTRSGQEVNADV